MHFVIKVIDKLIHIHPVSESSLLYCHIKSTASAKAFYPMFMKNPFQMWIFI